MVIQVKVWFLSSAIGSRVMAFSVGIVFFETSGEMLMIRVEIWFPSAAGRFFRGIFDASSFREWLLLGTPSRAMVE